MDLEVPQNNPPPILPSSQNISTQDGSISQQSRTIVWILGFILVAVLGLFLYVAISTENIRIRMERFIEPYIPSENFVQSQSQPLSERMYIKKAGLARPGFIIFASREPLGTSTDKILSSIDIALLPAGKYFNIPIPLDRIRAETLGVMPGSLIYVALYYDNGDGLFDKEKDILVRNIFGNPIVSHFTVL